jgi:hypothetical protein
VLKAVCCRGAVEERSRLIIQLRHLVHNNPAMCEQFFLVQPPSAEDEPQRPDAAAAPHARVHCARHKPVTAWSTAIAILEETDTTDAAPASAIIHGILSLLCTVARQVGIGVENLRELLGMTIRSGRWASYSSAILDALHAIVLGDPASGGGTESLEGAGRVFVFDGLQAGLFLGRFAAWPFDSGFAFETWVWHDGCSPGTGRILLRILASDDGAGGGRAAGDRDRAVVEVILRGDELMLITAQSASKKSPLTCHTRIPSRQWVHLVISHRKGGLLSRAEVDVTVNGQLTTYLVPFPKVSSPAVGVSVLVACAQCDPTQDKPLLLWEKTALTLHPFKGLMRTVRFYAKPLTAADARVLASAARVQRGDIVGGAGVVSHEPHFYAQPHKCFPVFSQGEGGEFGSGSDVDGARRRTGGGGGGANGSPKG